MLSVPVPQKHIRKNAIHKITVSIIIIILFHSKFQFVGYIIVLYIKIFNLNPCQIPTNMYLISSSLIINWIFKEQDPPRNTKAAFLSFAFSVVLLLMGIPLPIPSVFSLCFQITRSFKHGKHFGSRQQSFASDTFRQKAYPDSMYSQFRIVPVLQLWIILKGICTSYQVKFSAEQDPLGNTKTENLLFPFHAAALLLGTLPSHTCIYPACD